MGGGIRPGQVPDWRPGAEFWKPLADGREVTVYPLLYGKGRLCVGPLADPDGYDIAYRYESVAAAIGAAEAWDGEESVNPPDFEEIEFGGERHPGTIYNPTENPLPNVGDYVAPKAMDDIHIRTDAVSGREYIQLRRMLDDGREVSITGEKKVRTDGLILVSVEEVDVTATARPRRGVTLPPHHAVRQTPSVLASGGSAETVVDVDVKADMEDPMHRLIKRDAEAGR